MEQQKEFSIPQALQLAVQHHQAGRLQQAEQIYRKCLDVQPENPDALHLLGVLAHQTGNNPDAEKLISQAIARNPGQAIYHSNLGAAQKAMSKWKEAQASFEQALKVNSQLPDAYNNLGSLYLETGDHEKALLNLRKAVSLNPAYADALSNLGFLLLQKNKLEEAKTYLKRALAANPNHVPTYINLGLALATENKFEEAAQAYGEVLKRAPNHKESLLELSMISLTLGEPEKAEKLVGRLLELDPENPTYHDRLASVLQALGKKEGAAAKARKALELDPNCGQAYFTLTNLRKPAGVDDADILAAEAALGQRLDDTAQTYFHYGLARDYERLKEYDKAFSHLERGAALKRKTFRYSTAEQEKTFQNVKKTFTEEFFQARMSWGSESKQPIFILGMPRSGTTLVEQILSAHPQVCGAGELIDLRHVARTTLGDTGFPEDVPSLSAEQAAEMGESYVTRTRRFAKTGETFITDKMPGNFKYIGLIKTILPHAKIIHCRRSPEDTCFSCFKQLFTLGHTYTYDLTELGEYYTLYRDLMAHWEKVLPGAIYTIDYEKLVENQEEESRNLLEFCGLDWHEDCLNFHTQKRAVLTASAMQVRQPMYKGSVALWQRYEKHLGPLLAALHKGEKDE